MSDNMCLVLRLEGPFQAWGRVSQYSVRGTTMFPSKSAITGIFCAADGAARGTAREKEILMGMRDIDMLSVSTGNAFCFPLEDFHTVHGTLTASTGKPRKYVDLTHRYYLQDAKFWVFLSGCGSFLKRVGEAIQNPLWGIWLGRKCCIPSAPIYFGRFHSAEVALSTLFPAGLAEYPWERDVSPEGDFFDGNQSSPDIACSFLEREFEYRKVYQKL